MQYIFGSILIFISVFFSSSFLVSAQSDDQNCDKEAVISWIKEREAHSERFELADSDLSNNLTDWRRIPRFDAVVAIQQIRRDFEDIPYPECSYDLYIATVIYWTRRIDTLTQGVSTNTTPDSLGETANFYQTQVVQAIYDLEASANIDYFVEAGKERPSDIQPASVQIRTGEIIISSTDVEKVVSVDTVTLPNCNGSSPISITRTFTKSSERRVVMEAEGSAEIAFGIAKAEIETYSALDDNQSMSESLELQMSAAPGTTVTYEIEWVEISTTGVLEITKGDEISFLEFSVPNALRANIRQPIQIPCIPAESTAESP